MVSLTSGDQFMHGENHSDLAAITLSLSTS